MKSTIDEYNSFCDQGYDEIFVKDRRYLWTLSTPPYYAVECRPSFLETIGGIKINQRIEALNHQDNAIPGLYAAGVDTRGWESDIYCGILSGSTFAFAINSGRIVGENAAEYISAKSFRSKIRYPPLTLLLNLIKLVSTMSVHVQSSLFLHLIAISMLDMHSTAFSMFPGAECRVM